MPNLTTLSSTTISLNPKIQKVALMDDEDGWSEYCETCKKQIERLNEVWFCCYCGRIVCERCSEDVDGEDRLCSLCED